MDYCEQLDHHSENYDPLWLADFDAMDAMIDAALDEEKRKVKSEKRKDKNKSI